MLSFSQKIAFLLFALLTGSLGLRGFLRLYRRLARGRSDTDARLNHLPKRIWYAILTTLTQSRTFRKRPWISFFHSLIFYGFAFYLLVNLLDAIDGFIPLSLASLGLAGNIYVFLADILSALVLIGVIVLVLRRFLLPSRRDFTFNERTLLHKDVKTRRITFDSIFVSAFILFHVGSRAIGAGAKIALEGPDRFAPFATLLSHLFNPKNAEAWRIFGYWGALGSVLAFLMYFPYSKHIHIFMAPAKYLVRRDVMSGVLPAVILDIEEEKEPKLGVNRLEDLAWPRLLDAYACIQCNRCQDVCPATATGKALSPSALEINKRMELNELSKHQPSFERGTSSPNTLLTFAISPEAAWACTTCGACIDVCPVHDEPMLDIIDIRRQQVMIEGEFPSQLQTAFRGMERAKNPWGINHDKRMDWTEGLLVKTIDENPEPDVLFWVGCAASYDPQSQKTARAFVQLLDHAGVDFAVLGKRECCTGDSARRAGNEYLYRQLAEENVATLNDIKPKLIVATCPHCMNSVGKEYKQLGGDYKVMHHAEYLESLVASGKLLADSSPATIAFHDPCYLGRHNGVYDAPRNILNILSNSVVELDRNRENSFCCGAGGAQFWKEEEHGTERISDNRYREAQATLAGAEEKVLAVGCPFCKSMLDSTPAKSEQRLAVRDIAELLLEGVQRRVGINPAPSPESKLVESNAQPALTEIAAAPIMEVQVAPLTATESVVPNTIPRVATEASSSPGERRKWVPKVAIAQPAAPSTVTLPEQPLGPTVGDAGVEVKAPKLAVAARKVWTPKAATITAPPETYNLAEGELLDKTTVVASAPVPEPIPEPAPPTRKAWSPKQATESLSPAAISTTLASEQTAPVARKAWVPKSAGTKAQPDEEPSAPQEPK